MTVQEAQEVLDRLEEVPLDELSDEELREYEEAIEVLDASNSAGEILSQAVSLVGGAGRTDPSGEQPVLASADALRSGTRALMDALGEHLQSGVTEDELIESLQGRVGHSGLAGAPGAGPAQLARVDAAKQRVALARRQRDQERLGLDRDRQVEPDRDEDRPVEVDDEAFAAREQVIGSEAGLPEPGPTPFELRRQRRAAPGRDPIGVDKGFIAQRESRGTIISGRERAPGKVHREPPRYFHGDQFVPAGQLPEKIQALQKKMEDAGLLDPDEYWPGRWDSNSVKAYSEVLGMSNAAGVSQEKMLEDLRSAHAQRQEEQVNEQIQAIKARSFMPPDYASLSQEVKDYAEQQLKRELEPYEVQLLANQMRSDHRAKFEAEQEAAIAQARAQEEATGEEEVVESATVQQVDPRARFREKFEDRYSAELERREDVEDAQENFGLVMQSLRGMDQLVG